MRRFLRDNPILGGCVGFIGCLGLIAAGVFVMGALSVRACSAGVGLDSVASTAADANRAGYSLQIESVNGVTTFRLVPKSPRLVTCDELWMVIEPHLRTDQTDITIHSETLAPDPNPDSGSESGVVIVPLECSRSGASEVPETVL
ncbi:MAG: hypothetical protein VX498_14535 [Myxococcota bacterium]|nr:hypothetical protein [Myxococcota bacterium]